MHVAVISLFLASFSTFLYVTWYFFIYACATLERLNFLFTELKKRILLLEFSVPLVIHLLLCVFLKFCNLYGNAILK